MNFLYFFLTFFVELFIVHLFVKKKFKRTFLYVLLINLFTWPLASLFVGLGVNFFLVEVCVVFVESILVMLLFRLGFEKSLLVSFLANGLSALSGFFLSFSFQIVF